jgi:hypothetical protein
VEIMKRKKKKKKTKPRKIKMNCLGEKMYERESWRMKRRKKDKCIPYHFYFY